MFQAVAQGSLPTADAIALTTPWMPGIVCNGYWHGRAGMDLPYSQIHNPLGPRQHEATGRFVSLRIPHSRGHSAGLLHPGSVVFAVMLNVGLRPDLPADVYL